MENVKRTTRRLALVLGGVMAVAPATWSQNAAAPTQKAAPTPQARSASCLLQIVAEPSILSLRSEIIEYLFESSGVHDRAAGEVLGLAPGSALAAVQFLEQGETGGPINEQRTLLRLAVQLPEDVPPAAREFMASMITYAESALRELFQGESSRLDRQIDLTNREAERAEVELAETQKDLLAISPQNLSSQTLRNNITAITSQLQSLRLERASKEVYGQAVRERLGEIRAQTAKSLQEDVVTAELQRIVERREAELKRVQELVKTSVAASTELDAVEDKLATARIDLARRRDELGKTGVAGDLGQLTGELATLTLEAVQAQAKEKELNQQLKEAQDALPLAADYERTMLKLEVAKRNLQEAIILQNRAKQRLRMLVPPSVSVIGN